MPPFDFLSDGELDELIDYIQNLGGKDMETNNYQPLVPIEYRDAESPNAAFMMSISADYDPNLQEFVRLGC